MQRTALAGSVLVLTSRHLHRTITNITENSGLPSMSVPPQIRVSIAHNHFQVRLHLEMPHEEVCSPFAGRGPWPRHSQPLCPPQPCGHGAFRLSRLRAHADLQSRRPYLHVTGLRGAA